MRNRFINLQLFGIDYLTCDICGRGFPDVIDYYYCEYCFKCFCSEECAEEAEIVYRYLNSEGDEVDIEEDYDYREICSCKFCRKEDFKNEDILKYLLEKHNIDINKVKEEMKEKYKEKRDV